MTLLRRGWRWLADDPRQTRGVRILQIAIGLMLLFRVFTEVPFASYLWGPNGLGWGSASFILGSTIGGLLDRAFATHVSTLGVLVILATGALGLFLGYRTRPSTALSLVAFFLLEQRLPELADGGDNITRLVLTYMIFLLPAGARPARGSLAVWLHNVAVLAIALQVVVLYATSGLMKAYGDRWHHGTAMYYISQVEWFSLPALRELFKNPVITTVATYAPIVYQILFPIAMISPVKLPWIAAGVAFHLGIAVFMGLITFSTVMIGLELFLISDPEYTRIRERVQWVRERVVLHLRAKTPTAPALRLFIDGSCPHCRATGRFIQVLDRGGRIEVMSFRHDDSYLRHGIHQTDLERRMHLVDLRGGDVRSGFEAVCALTAQIPCLWPVRPILALVAWLGLGERLYDNLAARRRIILHPGLCRGACDVGEPQHAPEGDNV